MSIEDYWNDVAIYYIEFTVNKKGKNYLIKQTIILNIEAKYNLQEIIKMKFSDVTGINYIDNIGEGLCLKGER